jgi:hypothetical protein
MMLRPPALDAANIPLVCGGRRSVNKRAVASYALWNPSWPALFTFGSATSAARANI